MNWKELQVAASLVLRRTPLFQTTGSKNDENVARSVAVRPVVNYLISMVEEMANGSFTDEVKKHEVATYENAILRFLKQKLFASVSQDLLKNMESVNLCFQEDRYHRCCNKHT